jgi:MFS family permease
VPYSRATRLWVVALLAVGNLLNYLDRNIIFSLFEPIKRDLRVTDAQLGWLGSAYAIVFALGSLVAGVLADLRSRRAVIAGGVAVWSAFTALGAFARSYLQLFATRAVVGVAQSSYLPAGQAMLADYYPHQGRAQAMGIFWIGLALGGVMAVWLGGALEAAFGWRATLVVVGLPGVAFALLLARLQDPRMLAVPGPRPARTKFHVTPRVVLQALSPLIVSLLVGSAVFGFLALFENLPPAADTAAFGVIAAIGLIWTVWRGVLATTVGDGRVGEPVDVVDEMVDAAALVLRTPTLIWLFLGGALTAAAMNAMVAWSPSYLQRELDLTLAQAGQVLGPGGLLAGVLGSWTGGRLGDLLFDRTAGGRVIASALGFLIGAPVCVAMLLVQSVPLFTLLFILVVFFYTWYNGPVAAVLFDVVPPKIAATVMGAYVFFIHIAGDAIALPVVGALSDRYGLRPAMFSLPVVGLLGGAVLLFALLTVGRDMGRVRSQPAGA